MGLLRKSIMPITFAIAVFSFTGNAREVTEDYNRSSLYTISIVNTGTTYGNTIVETMLQMQHPDRFNDHNLSLRVVQSAGDPKEFKAAIDKFLIDNQIAKRMVSKWFNRDKSTGAFDMELIRQRGHYNATAEDVILANNTIRGTAMLADAGEQLIGNSFVIVNDISYVDKEEKSMITAAVFQGLSYAASIAASTSSSAGSSVGNMVSGIASAVQSVSTIGEAITKEIAGFTAIIHSYLYRLVWTDEVAGLFYKQYYYDSSAVDNAKKLAYERDLTNFKLEYVGDYKAKSSKTVLKGLHNSSEVFNKVLTRTIDENIVKLQEEFPVFHVCANIFKVTDDNKVHIHVGMKEGLKPSSKYEVLERIESEDCTLSYRRVAVLSPDPDLIWDNRCYAVEEEADNAGLKYSTFNIVSGSGVSAGMLVREL